MEDSTPGSAEDQQQGVQQTSPETSQQTPADNGQQATSTTDTTQGAEEGTPQVDNSSDNTDNSQVDVTDEVADWAKKQGYDLENLTADQAKTLAKRVMDNQKAFHDAQSRLKAAEQVSEGTSEIYSDDSENPVLTEANKALAAIRTESFFNKNPEAEQYAGKMVELIQQERETYGDDAARILANNLPRLYTLAKADSAGAEASASYDQGRMDERQNLAKSQQAAGPQTSAVNSAPQGSVVTDKAIGQMSTEEYLKWKQSGGNPWDVPVQ